MVYIDDPVFTTKICSVGVLFRKVLVYTERNVFELRQAEKLKSRKMKEGWMKSDEGWMKNDEGWMKKDEGWIMNDEGWWFQAVEGFRWRTNEQTNERTDRHLWL